ncbi:hypothetical protein AB0K23_37425 [Streptomyces sp. NPDC049602]|uniref:hypothetical protein n=1 Tax=Streptomyces sp. NPDC049602 TaxID=3155504 RepID=UPI0034203E22
MPRSRDAREMSQRGEQHLPATAAFLAAIILALTVAMAAYGMPVETIITVLVIASGVAVEVIRRLTGVFHRRRS